MSKRVVISAGGTGGHLFPAQALASQLKEKIGSVDVLFMAKGLETNSRFKKGEYLFSDIPSGPISPKKLIFSLFSITYGIVKSFCLLRKFKPKVVIGFGSYHSFPVLVAAKLLGIDLILHEANSIPGKVNKLFSPYAAWTGIFFPDAAKYLSGKLRQTDIPLRTQFYTNNRVTREEAIRHYALEPDVCTVLVFGGSLGAKRLNELAFEALSMVQKKVQVLHFTGSKDTAQSLQDAYAKAHIKAHVAPFESSMHYAWAAADLAITRSGASTVAEAITYTVPTIFVPYPHSADGHQDKNAEYVATGIGGALTFQEKDLTSQMLCRTIEEIPLHKMKEALYNARENMQKIHFSDLVVDFIEAKT